MALTKPVRMKDLFRTKKTGYENMDGMSGDEDNLFNQIINAYLMGKKIKAANEAEKEEKALNGLVADKLKGDTVKTDQWGDILNGQKETPTQEQIDHPDFSGYSTAFDKSESATPAYRQTSLGDVFTNPTSNTAKVNSPNYQEDSVDYKTGEVNRDSMLADTLKGTDTSLYNSKVVPFDPSKYTMQQFITDGVKRGIKDVGALASVYTSLFPAMEQEGRLREIGSLAAEYPNASAERKKEIDIRIGILKSDPYFTESRDTAKKKEQQSDTEFQWKGEEHEHRLNNPVGYGGGGGSGKGSGTSDITYEDEGTGIVLNKQGFPVILARLVNDNEALGGDAAKSENGRLKSGWTILKMVNETGIDGTRQSLAKRGYSEDEINAFIGNANYVAGLLKNNGSSYELPKPAGDGNGNGNGGGQKPAQIKVTAPLSPADQAREFREAEAEEEKKRRINEAEYGY